MDNHDKAFCSDVSYIKTVMSKAEFSYEHFRRLFLVFSLYSFVTGILLSILRTFIYRDSFLTGNNLRDVLINKIIEGASKVVMLLPVLVFMMLYRKKVRDCGQSLSLWLFDIISYVIIFCGSVLPLVTISVTISYEAADIFTILTSALCMLLCGVFTGDKHMKYISYAYFIIPALSLAVLGMIFTYSQFADSYIISLRFITIYSYIKAFFYTIYPCVGYFIISLRINKLGTVKTVNEV